MIEIKYNFKMDDGSIIEKTRHIPTEDKLRAIQIFWEHQVLLNVHPLEMISIRQIEIKSVFQI